MERSADRPNLSDFSHLRVYAALLDGEGHAVDRAQIASDAVVPAVRVSVLHDGVKSIHEDVFQLLVDHRFLPEVPLSVLHPLEVGGSHTTSVRKNVGDDKDFFVLK